jgi:hypothetical protein
MIYFLYFCVTESYRKDIVKKLRIVFVILDEREYQVNVDIKNDDKILETGYSDVEKPNSKETCFK